MIEPTSKLLTPEMHELQRADVEYFTDRGFKIKGIVHVGANTGQELPWYIDHFYLPIIAFEPHPTAFRELHRIYNNFAICSPFALGNKSGSVILHIPEDGDTEKSSKYLPIETPGHDWTSIPITTEVSVPLIRFDSWVRNHLNIVNIEAYDTLVIDAQGMELEVLQGFGKYINGFHFLVVECSAKPVYDGEASAEEVINYLASKGFMQLTPIEEHDDIIFKRRGLWD